MKPIATNEGITYEQLEQLTGGNRNAQEALQAVEDEAKVKPVLPVVLPSFGRSRARGTKEKTMAISGTVRENNYPEKTIFPTGSYDMTFVTMDVAIHIPPKSWENPEPYFGFRFSYVDTDGDNFTTEPARVPIDFSFNEKAWLFKHLSALLGRPITAVDEMLYEIQGINAFKDWEKLPCYFTGGHTPVIVDWIKVNGENVLTPKVVTLALEKKTYTKKDGTAGENNKLVSILPKSTEGKKKSGQPQPAQVPAGAPA